MSKFFGFYQRPWRRISSPLIAQRESNKKVRSLLLRHCSPRNLLQRTCQVLVPIDRTFRRSRSLPGHLPMTTIGATMTSVARAFFFALLVIVLEKSTSAFEWSAGGKHPEVDRLALAGLWKLTPRIVPMKEFTVYPKQPTEKLPNYLLMLKEDGSFQQYKNEEGVDVDASWSRFQAKNRAHGALDDVTKGKWDYVDGKLILAADRPESGTQSSPEDKLLVGRVVASYESSLDDNPVLKTSIEPSQATATAAIDAHLSVPRGSIKIGRFMYPTRHPSFFEQPMFQPKVKRFAFSLQQVLGSLNARQRKSEESIEKYKNSDFYNKTFLLTSHPIPQRQPKGRKRWSIKLNRFVDDPPSKAAQAAHDDEADAPILIRVMQVVFHGNHTFNTVAGLGEAILRGKWDVIGQEKDQLWMQVWRFGFGRSVSGSTFSEGKSLTHDDAKSYWGTIRTVDDSSVSEGDIGTDGDASLREAESGSSQMSFPRLEVKGSVMFGWGLEPLPVARFVMKEVARRTDERDNFMDDEEEDEDDSEGESQVLKSLEENRHDGSTGDDGIDWSKDAFQ